MQSCNPMSPNGTNVKKCGDEECFFYVLFTEKIDSLPEMGRNEKSKTGNEKFQLENQK